MTKAMIIGGGVAGSVAAMALNKAGVEAVVYERYPHAAADIGAFLTFAVNGMDALRSIEANTPVIGLGFPTPTLKFTSGSGKTLGEIPLGGNLADGTVTQTIKRAELYGALQDEAQGRGVRVEYGKKLVGAETLSGGRVRARFDDGTSDEGDVLIGADGIHSTVRGIIDPHAPEPRYVPVLNVGGYASGIRVASEPGVFHMTFGKRAFFAYTVTASGEVWWFANPPRRTEPNAAELNAITDAQWRAELHDLFEDDNTPALQIIDATRDEIRAWATYDIPKVPTWHRDSMIVIGDAAHATSPASGQGASMAIEDAVILAKCLRDVPDTQKAFATYESLRRDRVERIVAAGARSSNSKAAGPIGRVLRDAFLPIFLKKMAKGGDKSAAFMFDHHIDWEQPVAVA
ncbi:FAD-dependent oxidoreductase [Antrihabitans cavernicola]|uniref:FAD-dependent monooxygenase n=1 Tax=Antrihabitans cavernicola TaxID=2495913 RepID=A0A5A7SKD2_9NOCA|nr:FAD-dependent monooxygenase [Spelaeibacter cavernicola]KAA0024661.1 FAD-dependent monooxygenase [Spelaeibacter cavernicola]